MRPITIPASIRILLNAYSNSDEDNIALVKKHYHSLLKGEPEVSVIIPAYNEGKSILQTLLSISANKTNRSVEIIVANNNSADNTEALVKATGIHCVLETKQSITAARNAGFAAARGTYVLNADADSIYSPDWIDLMIAPLEKNQGIALVYGRFAFIPGASSSRFMYFVYEHIADVLRWTKKKFKEEAMNVYGCNLGFRRAQGIAVNGFDHPEGEHEDSWLAMKLRNQGFGKLYPVTNVKAIVWTNDRRIEKDGGLLRAMYVRVKAALFPGAWVVRKDI